MPAWTLETEHQLFFSIIRTHVVGSIEWAKVIADMEGNYSKEGCRQHYNKLIKSCRKGNTDTPQTPKKSRNAASAKGTPTSGRKRKQVQMANDEGEDDENLPSESPKIKKRKQEVEGDRKLKLESISEAESVELYED